MGTLGGEGQGWGDNLMNAKSGSYSGTVDSFYHGISTETMISDVLWLE